jgi:hypothetical protein
MEGISVYGVILDASEEPRWKLAERLKLNSFQIIVSFWMPVKNLVGK